MVRVKALVDLGIDLLLWAFLLLCHGILSLVPCSARDDVEEEAYELFLDDAVLDLGFELLAVVVGRVSVCVCVCVSE